MSSQPAKEWDEMSQQTQDEIKARLFAAVDTKAAITKLAKPDWHALARR